MLEFLRVRTSGFPAQNERASCRLQRREKLRGFTVIELMIVVAIVIVMSGISIISMRSVISSQRLQEVSWQMVQDLRLAKEDAILYQQDLNVYLDYDNSSVEPTNASNNNNRVYFCEMFQWGKDQTAQADDQHYVPTDTSNRHFAERVLKYGIVIDSIASGTSSAVEIPGGGKDYFVICFRSGAGSSFRGEGDLVTAMTGRANTTSGIIDSNRVVVRLKDPATAKVFYVIVEGAGQVSMYGSPP